MKKIEVIIRPFELQQVKDALAEIGVEGMTIVELKGLNQQRRLSEIFRGNDYAADLLPRIKIEVVVLSRALESVLAALERIGSREIIVSDIEEAIRIRTAEKGELAV